MGIVNNTNLKSATRSAFPAASDKDFFVSVIGLDVRRARNQFSTSLYVSDEVINF